MLWARGLSGGRPFLAALPRLLFPLQDQELGVQYQQFRYGFFEASALVHTLANHIHRRLSDMFDPLHALGHEGERPEGVTLTVGAVTGGLAAAAMS